MGFVDYYGLETLRREFVQPPRLEQGLVRCDGPCLTFDSFRITRKWSRQLTNQRRPMPYAYSPAQFLPPNLAADVSPAPQLALPALCC
jgi:hypothetical protein